MRTIRLRRKPPNPEGNMTVWEHLAELRTRIFRSMIYLFVGFVFCFIFLYDPAMALITAPFRHGLGADKLLTTGLVETVAVKVKVVFYLAIAVTMPLLLWEIWRFIVPGLTAQEKKWARPFLACAIVFFFLGIVIGYLILEPSVEFMKGFAGPDVTTAPFLNQYLTLFIFMILAFGLTFEFPLLLILLEAANIVNWRQLMSGWRYAVVGIAFFSAVITPSQDPFSFFAMAIPMSVFYFGAIAFGFFVWRDRGQVHDDNIGT